MQVNILEAKNRLSQIIKSVLTGENVVIANRGKPVVKLVPIHNGEEKRSPAALSQWLAENPLPDYQREPDSEIDDVNTESERIPVVIYLGSRLLIYVVEEHSQFGTPVKAAISAVGDSPLVVSPPVKIHCREPYR